VVEKKKSTKNQLAQLKNKYLVDIYGGLAKGQNIRAIHKKLYDETINQKKLGLATSDKMLKVALASASSLKKKIGSPTFVAGYVKTTYGSQVDNALGIDLLSIFVFDLLDKNKIEKKLSHEITVEADKTEGDTKSTVIAQNIEKNRELENPKVFYLASQHKDSASDHKDYQGKMYIDEKWRSVVKDKDQVKAIEQYISKHDVKTIQWVTGEPVWFITRPNCRHYFMELGTVEVLGLSKTKLLEKYKMETAIGNREYLQTIKHSTSKEWYKDVRNAQLLLEKYKERLALHQEMYKTMPNDIIKKAIAKDKMLIDKWEKYINEKEK
jgi:hypothetical protein